MYRFLFFRYLLLLCITCSYFISNSQELPSVGKLKDFSGVCHSKPEVNAVLGDAAVGWERMDIYWGRIEPEQGKWNTEKLEEYGEKILQFKRNGVTVLPILCYTASWAGAGKPDQQFEMDGEKFAFLKQADGSYIRRQFRLKTVNGESVTEYIDKKQDARKISNRWLSKNHQQDWNNYVEKVVRFLSAPPYNLQYFQIWNEAHPTSGFWAGDMDTYMQRIHIPASKIIQNLGGKVVYGGWPCCGKISTLINLIDKYNAWDTFDVIDIHYFPLEAMEMLHKELKKRNIDKGIWQSEMGFGTDPNLIGNLYPRALQWALNSGWDYPDKYKLFFFAYWSPNDPKAYGYGRTLLSGENLSVKGKSLKTLGELFGADTISLFKGVSSEPQLNFEINELQSSIEAFKVGNKIICAVHLLSNNNAAIFVDRNGNGDTYHLNHGNPYITLKFEDVLAEKILKVERVSMTGTVEDISGNVKTVNGGIKLPVYIRENKIEKHEYVDMPEDILPQVFYTVISLKDNL
ncbi:hypothetical protein ACUNWD_19765 [Sunxiuqinia sp. A32]|uniref:hypothetical protein n=1 Tax=Sunxiuqinia sp. A32 TaxID=3461496 RepID=UPI004045A75A